MMEKAIKEMRISELRALQYESDEMIVEGYAAVFEKETDLGWCKEIIDRNAQSGCYPSCREDECHIISTDLFFIKDSPLFDVCGRIKFQ